LDNVETIQIQELPTKVKCHDDEGTICLQNLTNVEQWFTAKASVAPKPISEQRQMLPNIHLSWFFAPLFHQGKSGKTLNIFNHLKHLTI